MKKDGSYLLRHCPQRHFAVTGCGASASDSSTSGNSGDSAASGDAGELYVYNWGEYIDESVIDEFEEETGIKGCL